MPRNKKHFPDRNYAERNHTGAYVRGKQPRTSMDVHRVFREFANGTSMHGVPRIINARSIVARIFWSVICIGAFTMFTINCGILLSRFYSYPKKVNVEIIQRPVQFPWVSVCNSGHMDLLATERLNDLITEGNITENPRLDAFTDAYELFWANSGFLFQHIQMQLHELGFSITEYKEILFEVYSRLGLAANIGTDLASDAGIQLEELIITLKYMSTFYNVSTSMDKIFDPYYFNCFTFKSSNVVTSNANRLQGVEYGLSLLLFTGTAGQMTTMSSEEILVPGMEEADISLASGRSARVVVHAPGTPPHFTAAGYDIPPGFSVTVGVKARENVRISQPHGNCTASNENSTYKYTLTYCQINCLQNAIMKNCGCVDNKISIPEDTKGLPFCLQLPEVPEMCFYDFGEKCKQLLRKWSSSIKCRGDVYANMTVHDPLSIDACLCHPPCNDIEYDTMYSLSTIPPDTEEHTSFYFDIESYLYNMSPQRKKILQQYFGDEYQQYVKDHFISRLNVHIADSNVIKTVELPDYEPIRLVSDIGGQLGLWIGMILFLFNPRFLCYFANEKLNLIC